MSQLPKFERKSADKREIKNGAVTMAPAVLTNGKGVDKAKTKSKQNRKKMDLNGDGVEEEKPTHIDFGALKAKLVAEDTFISGLLAHIPIQVVTVDPEDGSETSEEVLPAQAERLTNRATNPDELKEKLAAKLSQFKGKKNNVELFGNCNRS